MQSSEEPGATIETLRRRAELIANIRSFFAKLNVLEVATPVLGATGASDLHLTNVVATDESNSFYLQTSPEYFMKRLLAAGSGAIFQIGPAFRGGESGARHNIEFTMLEWYRPEFDLESLMGELNQLVNVAFESFDLDRVMIPTLGYRRLFEDRYGVNPHQASLAKLAEIASKEFPSLTSHISDPALETNDVGTRNDYLDLLFSSGIEPDLVEPTYVIGYPASQAALAKIENVDGESVARRFELFWHGLELANGYDELCDGEELAKRFAANNELRRTRSLPGVVPDRKLIAALDTMPACSGVALGIDRLLMLLLKKATIDEVVSFSVDRL